MHLGALGLLVFVASAVALTCGTVGNHDPSKLTIYMGNFFYRGSSTFLMCGLYCRKDAPRCKSFRYSFWPDAAGQYCEFFQDGLDGNVTADSTQPYYYYDIGCALPLYGDIQLQVTTSTVSTTITSVSTTTYSTERTSTTTISAPPQTITIRPQTPSPSTISVTVTVTYTVQPSPVRIQDTEPITTTTTLTQILTQTSLQERTVTSTSTVTRSASSVQHTTLTVTQTQRTCPALSTTSSRRSPSSNRSTSSRGQRPFAAEDVPQSSTPTAGPGFQGWWGRAFGLQG